MVEKRMCNFCGGDIEPGTGKMFVKKDGTTYNLCSNKCKKNLIDLKRVPRRTKWTKRYAELKESTLKHEKAMAEKEAEDKKAGKAKAAPAKKKPAAKKPAVAKPKPVKEAAPEPEGE